MRVNLIIMFSVLLQFCWSQEFTFELTVTDNKGNKDTVEIGYDRNGTDSVDINLGEENIAGQSWNKPLDVRCTNVWEEGIFPMGDTIELKRWISNLNCTDFKRLMHVKLDIYTDNWPITIKWDSSRLQNRCLNYSVISDRWVQHWFDVASANNIDLCMGGVGTGVFDRHNSVDDDHVRYENQTGDTIFFVYIGLGNEWITNSTTSPPPYCELMTSTTDHENEGIMIINNCVYLKNGAKEDVRYVLFSLNGRKLESGRIENEKKCIEGYSGIAIIELAIGERVIWKKINLN